MTPEPDLLRAVGRHVASLFRNLDETCCDPVHCAGGADNDLLAMALRFAFSSAKNWACGSAA
jgi:hypothetical protein